MTDKIELLRSLVRIETVNPPGNERPAIRLLESVLTDAGLEVATYALVPERPNLIARIAGRGTAPPLLLQGHVDVVPATGQWTRSPFGADVVDGFVWGRGTLDMKGPVVMMVDAFLRLAADPTPPAGDVILAILADEEMQGRFGAQFLVREHPDLFHGVRYCLGEFGAFPFRLQGRRFYPIQVGERVGVEFLLTIEGPAGHGSMPIRGGAMAKLGRILRALDRRRLPIHLTPATRLMVQALADHTSGPTRLALRRLLAERTAGPALRALGPQLAMFEPMFRNTVSPTVVRGGDKHNVIPGRVTLGLDGRMLPGVSVEEFERELRAVVGSDCGIEAVTDGATSPGDPDLGLFDLLAEALRRHDPEAIPIPFLLPAVTDGRWFAQLGIQPYGYTPMTLPDGFDFQRTVHAADERIPVDALDFGSDVLFDVLRDYA
ncbi:MAG TPA: M20/M25/M40 family metallo-hydrolase [Acidimicrobiia bacterium]|nr:M20/M25/M40 family metallo-hydrolase [Acidimicrobiia bacterium]